MAFDQFHRSTSDLDVLGISEPVPTGIPGKRPVTAGLHGRPQTHIIFRVESAEAATALAGALGPRDGNGVAAGADAAVDRAAGSSGAALPAELRERFGSSLGADLSAVRIHTGGDSAEAAGAVGARAYTTGNDIHFGAGQFDPSSAFGVHLLAHEVAHTVQQQGCAPTRQHKLEVSTPQDAAEHEADRAADAMVTGAPAAVSGAASALAAKALQRDAQPDGTAKPPAAATSRELTDDDKNRLDNAQQLISKATTNADTAIAALSAYGKEGSKCLESIHASYDAFIGVYDGEFKLVQQRIKEAKATNQLQQSVMLGALDVVLGPAASAVASSGLSIAGAVGSVQAAYSGMSEFMGVTESMGKGAVDQLGGESGGKADAGGQASVSKQLAFWQSFAKLQAASTQLVGLAAQAAEINRGIGKVQESIEGANATGKTRGDYAPAKIEDDAARLENGTRQLGAAAPTISAGLAQMKAAAAQVSALKADKKAVEKDIWINWIGSLPASETGVNGILDHDSIESHLKSIGVWGQLGIEIGANFSDDEEALAVCSAKAVSRVLAHKGSVVNIPFWGPQRVKLGDLPALPVKISGVPAPEPTASQDVDQTFQAQVSDASVASTLDPAMLEKTDRSKDMVVDLLFARGLVIVAMDFIAANPAKVVDPLNPFGQDRPDVGGPPMKDGKPSIR